jgi:predicted DNA-binding transcriptional regulator AlpA
MIVFPADHPIGRQQRQHLREKLLPSDERDELVRLHGELILPLLTKLLDAKVEELAAQYDKGWRSYFDALKEEDRGALLVSREEAAEMLGISLSSIQRLEKRGELPQPKRFGMRTVRHGLADILTFARNKGLRVHSSPK